MIKIIKKIKYKLISPKKRIELLIKEEGIKIGDGWDISGDVQFGSEPYLIEIGDNVRIAPGVKFVTHDGGLWVLNKNGMMSNANRFGKIKVGSNVHIGMNVVIMPDVTIGDNCIIGVGAIVTKNIPSNSIAVGVPARVIQNLDEYYEKHINNIDLTDRMTPEERKNYLINKFNIEY